METVLLWIGRLAGLLGALVVTIAVAARLAGTWHLGSLSVGTVLQGGIAAMVLGCLAYTALHVERARR